jgi:hypothetical protein
VPAITSYYGAFQDSKHIYIVMEYCARGDLLERLLNEGRAFSEVSTLYAQHIDLHLKALCMCMPGHKRGDCCQQPLRQQLYSQSVRRLKQPPPSSHIFHVLLCRIACATLRRRC